VDLQNPRGTDAALIAQADNQGYFTVRGLQRGRHYQLIARGRDDNRILAGATLATPPDPRLFIMVSEDLVPPGATIPDPETLRGRRSPDPGVKQAGPAATLEAPRSLSADPGMGGVPTPRPPSPPVAGPAPDPWARPQSSLPAVDPTHIVQGDG